MKFTNVYNFSSQRIRCKLNSRLAISLETHSTRSLRVWNVWNRVNDVHVRMSNCLKPLKADHALNGHYTDFNRDGCVAVRCKHHNVLSTDILFTCIWWFGHERTYMSSRYRAFSFRVQCKLTRRVMWTCWSNIHGMCSVVFYVCIRMLIYKHGQLTARM